MVYISRGYIKLFLCDVEYVEFHVDLGVSHVQLLKFMLGLRYFTIGKSRGLISNPAEAVDGLYGPISTKCDQCSFVVKMRFYFEIIFVLYK